MWLFLFLFSFLWFVLGRVHGIRSIVVTAKTQFQKPAINTEYANEWDNDESGQYY